MNFYVKFVGGVIGALLVAGNLYAAGNGKAVTASDLARLEILEIKDEIRTTIDLYTLLTDRDAGQPDIREWAERILTRDIEFAAYNADGSLIQENKGREAVITAGEAFIKAVGRPSTRAGRHILVDVYFDEVTPTLVKTRTTSFSISAERNLTGKSCNDCSGAHPHVELHDYYDTWVREDGVWKKSRSEEHPVAIHQ